MNQEKIAKWIKEIRLKNHLTQQDLAKHLGVTYQAVSKWENGKNIPDITIIQKLCQDYSLDIQEVLVGTPSKKKMISKKWYVLASCFLIIFVIGIVGIVNHLQNDKGFEFKTLTAMCDEFNITGSAAYDKNKTSIYISNINYCGNEDDTVYDKIECSLYESSGNIETKIKSCESSEEKTTLPKYVDQVTFHVDDYSAQCKNLSNANLYLLIHAYLNGKTTTYKVPLAFRENCSN